MQPETVTKSECEPERVFDDYVTFNDFVGRWTAYIVRPFDPDNEIHRLLGLQVGEDIEIKAAAIKVGSPWSLARTSDVVYVTNTSRDDQQPSWVVDYNSQLSELNGQVLLPTRQEAIDSMKNSDVRDEVLRTGSIREPFTLTIKYVGRVTQGLIDEATAAAECADEYTRAKFFDQIQPRLYQGQRDLLLTWTNRFKHPGGYAHVHGNH